jgi:hypothetical protein
MRLKFLKPFHSQGTLTRSVLPVIFKRTFLLESELGLADVAIKELGIKAMSEAKNDL